MNLELRYDKKNKRLYTTKEMVVVLVVIGLLLVSGIGLFAFRTYNSKLGLKAPTSEVAPITLGDASNLPKDSSSATGAVLQKMKDEVKGKLPIVFFYDGYKEQNQAQADIVVFKAALDIVEPYKSLKDLLVFKTLTSDGEKCHVENDQLICDQKLVDSFQALGIDHLKVVILSPKQFNSGSIISRGKNSFISISTAQNSLSAQQFKRWLGLMFTHELGHALGLKDEYSQGRPNDLPEKVVGTDEKSADLGKPNCAPDKQTAEKWWGDYVKGGIEKVGYFQGCAGNKNFYYPVDNTLMSAWPNAESYGQVSEDYLRGVISCFYGNKEAIVFQAGFEATYSAKFNNCESFKKEYPKFWEE